MFVLSSIQKCLPEYFRASPALRMQHEQSDSQLAVPNTRRGFVFCVWIMRGATGNWLQISVGPKKWAVISETGRPTRLSRGMNEVCISQVLFFFLFLNCCRISLSATNLRNNQTSQLTNCALDSENELNLIRQYRVERYFGLSPMYLSEPVKFMVLLISNACLETQTVAAPSTTHSLSAVAENDIGLAS